jgi:hypothetical protein
LLQVLNRNINGIPTDRPKLAKLALRERAGMSRVERLLTEVALPFKVAVPFKQPTTAPEPQFFCSLLHLAKAMLQKLAGLHAERMAVARGFIRVSNSPVHWP